MTAPRPLTLAALLAMTPLAQACDLSLSRGEIDYGSLNRTTLKAEGGQITLPPRSFQLTVQCSSEQPLRLSYAALAADPDSFRFSDHGHYQLWLSDARLDERPVALGLVGGAGIGVASSAREQRLRPEQALVPSEGGQALKGQRLVVKVEVRSSGQATAVHSPQASQWLARGSWRASGADGEMLLRASFTPASCTPRLGQGGVVDFGRITAGQLSLERTTLLQRSLALNVQCDGPTRFALTAKDNRAGTALAVAGEDSGTLFGIGSTQAGNVLGSYRLRVETPSADRPLTPLLGTLSGASWRTALGQDAAMAHNGQWLGFVYEGEGSAGPSALEGLTAELQVDLYVAPLQQLNLKEETPIQGSATLEIIYL